MKSLTRLLFVLAVYGCSGTVSSAQDTPPLTETAKQEAMETLIHLMNDFYVFPEVAKATETHLRAQWEEGHFTPFTDNETFAEALTESVQSINQDKHMRIRANPPYEAPPNSPAREIEEHLDRIDRSRQGNLGFNSVQILEGNIGYLDLRGFAGLERGKPLADAAMALMARTDAVIFDLRKNGGGSPRMVQYLCSFFFDEKVHLNSLYWREGDVTEEFWTLDEIGGERMPDVPLFVLTSSRTFSGAEEFSYNMQTQQRATLIGETTGGGANPGGTRRLNEHLSVFIPTGRAINPITKTNWEGVGVVPAVNVPAQEALAKAQEMAQEAAETYRDQRNDRFSQMMLELNGHCEKYQAGTSEEAIYQSLLACKTANLLEEWNINILGYEYLMEHEKPQIAAAILRANTLLYPQSANVYDSYAEALMMNGNLEASLENYQRAVELAVENEDDNLALFKRNLANLKERMEDKD